MSTDDDLLDQLRRIAAGVDPVPELVTASARAAFLTRRLDDEIATLLRDSAASPVAVRGDAAAPRRLSFELGEVSLELEFERAGASLALRGLALGTVGDVEVDAGPAGPHRAAPDEHGWFTVAPLPVGPVRVRVHAADGTAVSTGWIDG